MSYFRTSFMYFGRKENTTVIPKATDVIPIIIAYTAGVDKILDHGVEET